jgi:hypothetical protein
MLVNKQRKAETGASGRAGGRKTPCHAGLQKSNHALALVEKYSTTCLYCPIRGGENARLAASATATSYQYHGAANCEVVQFVELNCSLIFS